MLTYSTPPYILMVIAGVITLGVGLLFSFRSYARWQNRRELMAASRPDVAHPTEPADATPGTPRPAD